MDSHDVARGRGDPAAVLASVRQPTLVIGIDSDVLYPVTEQEALAESIPRGELSILHSDHGHDAFLIEFSQLNEMITEWLQRCHGASRHVPVGVPR
jgi:homoserine O-acetyltransferase/O-succinyltransferase